MSIYETQVNGTITDRLPVSDRAVQFGDGVFETLLVQQGRPYFLNRHLSRLRAGCERLGIDTAGLTLLRKDILNKAGRFPEAVIKIIISRGQSSRGYAAEAATEPDCIIRVSKRPDWPAAIQTDGIDTRLCETRLARQPLLAGIKHLNRLEQVLARQEWQDAAIREGLVRDDQGHVIEGTMSNLFLVKNGRLQTAELSLCGVAGVVRSVLFDIACAEQLPLDIGMLDVDSLCYADEVFVCNSVIGIWPVRSIHDIADYGVAGRVTRKLQQCLAGQAESDDSDRWYAT